MQIDWWTLVLQTINALVLVWLLTRFLFRPVALIITARQAAANAMLADAEAALAAADEGRQGIQRELDDLARQHKKTLDEAAAEAESLRQNLLDEAKEEARNLHRQSLEAIASLQRKAASEHEASTLKLALDIAGKLLERLPATLKVAAFLDELASKVSQLPEAQRIALGFDESSTLRLFSARSLDAQEQETIRQALSNAMGISASIDFMVDSGLIAGLELEGRHCSVRNSLRSDLRQLTTALQDGHASAN